LLFCRSGNLRLRGPGCCRLRGSLCGAERTRNSNDDEQTDDVHGDPPLQGRHFHVACPSEGQTPNDRTLGLSAGVDIAEVIDFASPAFATLGVAHVDPPDVLGSFNDGDGALVRCLFSAGAVRGTADVLLIRLAVHPYLPVATSHASQQVDGLTGGKGY